VAASYRSNRIEPGLLTGQPFRDACQMGDVIPFPSQSRYLRPSRSGVFAGVGEVGGDTQRVDSELGDSRSGIQRNRAFTVVDEFQSEIAGEPRLDHDRCRHQQPKAAPRRPSDDVGAQVPRESQELKRRSEHKLAWMKPERIAERDRRRLLTTFERTLHVTTGIHSRLGDPPKNSEAGAKPYVDRGRANLCRLIKHGHDYEALLHVVFIQRLKQLLVREKRHWSVHA
jgi:hypothetical protein